MAVILKLISVAAVSNPSFSFSWVRYFVNTGINALVRAPMTSNSKIRFGKRNAAKYMPSSSGANRAFSMRSRTSPSTRDVNTMETRIMAADPIVCCFLENNPQKRFIQPIIAIILFFCYTYPHADHKTGNKKVATRSQKNNGNCACAYGTEKTGKIHAEETDTNITNEGVPRVG